jgi:hypothetical protein
MLIHMTDVIKYIIHILHYDDDRHVNVNLGITCQNPDFTVICRNEDSKVESCITYKYIGQPERMSERPCYEVDDEDAFYERIRLSCCSVFDEFKAVDF